MERVRCDELALRGRCASGGRYSHPCLLPRVSDALSSYNIRVCGRPDAIVARRVYCKCCENFLSVGHMAENSGNITKHAAGGKHVANAAEYDAREKQKAKGCEEGRRSVRAS